jgi:hypothetical protein
MRFDPGLQLALRPAALWWQAGIMVLKSRSQESFDQFVSEANVTALSQSDYERFNEFVIAMRLDGGLVSDVPRDPLVERHFDEKEIDTLLQWLDNGLRLLEMWDTDRAGPDLGMPGR